MRRLSGSYVVALIIGLGLTGLACKQAESEESSNGSSKPTESCQWDGDCSSYFRCIEGTCSKPPAVTGEHDADTPRIRFYPADSLPSEDDADPSPVASFSIELALTSQQRSRGLMHRREMAQGWGMLFIYPDAQMRSFWMKNTLIPLDMIFIGSGGKIINIIASAEPMTRTPRKSKGPARYVLEINGGAAERNGLRPGHQMRLEGVPERLQP